MWGAEGAGDASSGNRHVGASDSGVRVPWRTTRERAAATPPPGPYTGAATGTASDLTWRSLIAKS
jgi:hypothetical protein